MAVDTENARRYFVGVQGDKKHKGELFGIQNMFTLRTGDKCLTEDILQVISPLTNLAIGPFLYDDHSFRLSPKGLFTRTVTVDLSLSVTVKV